MYIYIRIYIYIHTCTDIKTILHSFKDRMFLVEADLNHKLLVNHSYW